MILFVAFSVCILFGTSMGGIAYLNTGNFWSGLLAACVCTLVAAAVLHVATWEQKPDDL